MKISSQLQTLNSKAAELTVPFPITWRIPPPFVKDPVTALPDERWPLLSSDPPLLRKRQPNWFCGELVFPRTLCGLELDGTQAHVFIRGWCPFRLWIDGQEAFAETRAWHASGPIADPLPVLIRSGENLRFVLCLEPTEIPAGFQPIQIAVTAREAEAVALELVVAAAEVAFAERLAQNANERRRVEQAAEALDLEALNRNDWPAVRTSMGALEKALRFLSKRAKRCIVHCVGHSHIDMDWMWTWDDTVHCIRRDFKAVADLMDDHPEVTFAISQVPSYDVVRRFDPEVFERVCRYIRAGRWENVAGTWVEGDLLMADGESFVRHVRYATAWTQEHLGTTARVLWEPDTFGHPANMPQLARLGGFEAYFHMRTNPGREHLWPVREWEGLDGTRLLTVCAFYNGSLDPGALVETASRGLRFGMTETLHVWGIGDHGGGLGRWELERLAKFRSRPLIPTIRFSTVTEFVRRLRRRRRRLDLPRHRGETFHLFEGCWTTHVRLKQLHRRCEAALLTAESLCARAGLDRRIDLRETWIPVLFNQFHDLLDGSAVHDAYEDAYRRAEQSVRAAERVTEEAVRVLASPTSADDLLTLWNPLGFERTEPVWVPLPPDVTALEDREGHRVAVQRIGDLAVFVAEKVPAWGAATYRLIRGAPPPEPSVEVSERRDYWEQGEYYRVETDSAVSRLSKSAGIIGSWFDKRLNREFVPYGVPKPLSHTPVARLDLALNVFQVVDESPNGMSAWLIHNIRREETLVDRAEVRLLDCGPVCARFAVHHSLRSSWIEEEVLYWRRLARVDFRIRLQWAERGSPEVGVPQLKLGFAVSLPAPRVWSEGPFCVVERPADGQEQPTQKWVDVRGEGAGFTLCNNGRYGYDALGGRVRVTLVRNAYAPDPESDNGLHEVHLAFLPHGGDRPLADCVRAGLAFNRPLIPWMGIPAESGPGLHLRGDPSVVITGIEPGDTKGRAVLIRCFEAEGHRADIRLRVGRGVRRAELVDFRTRRVGGPLPVRRGEVPLRFHAWEVQTVRVWRDQS